MQVSPVATLPKRLGARAFEVWPGLLVCAAIAVAATLIGREAPLVGSAVPAVLLGFLVALVWTPPARIVPGITYASKFVLQCAVVLLGAQLSLVSIVQVGLESLPVMLVSLTVCLAGAWLVGRAMGVGTEIRTLIGVGTGICGASAIAAIAPIIKARSSNIAYAISTVFLFNVLAVLVFPPLGHALGMTPHQFGLFAGTAVNDTSSVVAAASVYSASALGFAVVVKLVRTLMIIPIAVTLAVTHDRKQSSTADRQRLTLARVASLIPWFLIGFVVMAGIGSLGVFNDDVRSSLTQVSIFLVATALAGIGLSTNLRAIREAGWRPLVLGGVLSLLVMGTTLGMMALLGRIG